MKKKLMLTGALALILMAPLAASAATVDTATPFTGLPHRNLGKGVEQTEEVKANITEFRTHITEYMDGKITLDKLVEYHEKLMPVNENCTVENGEENFKARISLEKDYKDGKITKEDFLAKMKELRPEGAGRADRPGKGNRNGMGQGLGNGTGLRDGSGANCTGECVAQ